MKLVFRIVAAVAVACGVGLGSAEARPLLQVDAPRAGATVAPSFHIGGWALDTASVSSSGIAVIHVGAYPAAGGTPKFLGFAAMSGRRPA